MSDTPRAGSSPAGPRVTLQVPRPGGGPRSELLETNLTVENAVGATRSSQADRNGCLGLVGSLAFQKDT